MPTKKVTPSKKVFPAKKVSSSKVTSKKVSPSKVSPAKAKKAKKPKRVYTPEEKAATRRKIKMRLADAGLIATLAGASLITDIYYKYTRARRAELEFQRYINGIRIMNLARNQGIPLPQIDPRRDTQNVHDTDVNKQSKDLYDKYKVPTKEEITNGIAEIKSEFSKDKDIIFVVDEILRRHRDHHKIERLNKTEKECLVIVWMNVKNDKDKKKFFVDSLKDCKTGPMIVCQTGVVNRIVVSMVIDNPELIPKNFTVELSNELQNLAIKIRNEVMANTDLNDDTKKTKVYREQLNKQAFEQYEKLIKDNKKLEKLLAPLLEACCD